jgi:LuxR family maltose regulon positive regulatory protein
VIIMMQKVTLSILSLSSQRNKLLELFSKQRSPRCIWVAGNAGLENSALAAGGLRPVNAEIVRIEPEENDIDVGAIIHSLLHAPVPGNANTAMLLQREQTPFVQQTNGADDTATNFLIVGNVDCIADSAKFLRELLNADFDDCNVQHVILCSQGAPPFEAARLIASGEIGYVNGQDFALCIDELRGPASPKAPDEHQETPFEPVTIIAQRIEASSAHLHPQQWQFAISYICESAVEELASGRAQFMREKISAIPFEIVEQAPWLLYWLARCEIYVDQTAARRNFMRAYELMKENEDTVGAILSISGLIESDYLEWNDMLTIDSWLEELGKSIEQLDEFPSSEIEAFALSGLVIGLALRNPSHARMPQWSARLLSIYEARAKIDINQIVVISTLILEFAQINCDADSATRVIGLIEPLLTDRNLLPANHVLWLYCHSRYKNFTGNVNPTANSDRFMAHVKSEPHLDSLESLVFLQRMMFEIDHLNGFTLQGDDIHEALDQLIRKAHAVRRLDIAWLFQGKALLYALQAKLDYAIQFAKMALDFASQRGAMTLRLHFLRFLAGLFAKQGQVDEARKYLMQARAHSPAGAIGYLECRLNLLDAGIALQKGNLPAAKELLQSAVSAAQQNGNHGPAWWPLNVTRLYQFSLVHGIEADFFQYVVPRKEILNVESRQFPIRIFSLGRFEIFFDDIQFLSNGKAQRKPLDLLKCLIAFGGTQVSSLTLIQHLWPDSDGDAAQATFDSTVLRLRRLLQRADAIVVSDGLVSINPKIVWLDTWAFEKLTGQIESIEFFESTGKTIIHEVTATILRLYRGHFLGHEEERSWTMTMRERLRSKWLRMLTLVGTYWEALEQWENATELYQRGLELDTMVEDLYRRLMHVHHRRGQLSSALDVYRRCKMMLSVVLGIKPSAETESIYRSITAEPKPELYRRRSTDKI